MRHTSVSAVLAAAVSLGIQPAFAGHEGCELTGVGARVMSTNAQGRAIAVLDAQGRVTRLAYDTEGRFVAAALPDGVRLWYAYDGARVAIASDSLGNLVTLSGDGIPVQLADPRGLLACERAYVEALLSGT